MNTNQKIKVLVVDDSLISKEIISKGIVKDNRIKVVGTASNPFEARDQIIELHPDVITLDINMPKMDGITFLKKLMAQYPIPVIVISSSANSVLEALDAGAVDFVAKPQINHVKDLENFINEIISKIKIAAVAKMKKTVIKQQFEGEQNINRMNNKCIDIIAIGASTGGTDAILTIIRNLPKNIPGIVIVQHMPPVFTKMYAERLNNLCALGVKEAQTGDEIKIGHVFIAPGDYQMKVYKEKEKYYIKCFAGEKVSGHCPSVDVLFHSVADTAKARSIGVILTGMGSDGAKGLMRMKKKGAYTIGQDKESSVVYGMPMVAYNIGAVKKQLPLERISQELIRYLK